MTAAATTCISVSTPTPVKVAPGKAPAAPSVMALGEVVIVQGSRITGEVLDLYLGSVAS